jgi:hypothetical protein
MNLEKRFLRVYGTMVMGTVALFLAGLMLHRRWLADVGGVSLGLTFQALILAGVWLATQRQALGHSRPVANILLWFIMTAVVLGIFAFQINRAASCLHDYILQNH